MPGDLSLWVLQFLAGTGLVTALFGLWAIAFRVVIEVCFDRWTRH